jgi:hypothetical protein
MAAPTPLPLNPVLPSLGRQSAMELATFCVLATCAGNEALERPSPATPAVPDGAAAQVAVAAKETGDSGLAPSVELAESVTVVVFPLHGDVTAGAERSRTSGRPALSGAVYRAADVARLLMGVSRGLLAAVSLGWDGMTEGEPYIYKLGLARSVD